MCWTQVRAWAASVDILLQRWGNFQCISSLIFQYQNVSVYAVDISSDFTNIASDLTRRAGLDKQIEHVCSDLNSLQGHQFDGVVSFLCFCHIENKQSLFENISKNMKAGSTIYFEDLILVLYSLNGCIVLFFQSDKSVAKTDLDLLADVVSSPNLINLKKYVEILEKYFSDVVVTDLTEKWSVFTRNRSTSYTSNREAIEELQGSAAFESYKLFYDTVADLFERGAIRGVVITARKM